MATWSRERGHVKQRCQVCQVGAGTRLCDGVLRHQPTWRLCNVAMCEICTTRWGKADYCRACGLARGLIQRDPGEEG